MTTEEQIVDFKTFRDNKMFEDYEVWDEEKQLWCDYSQSCYSQQSSFPNPEDPTHEVTVITCYDSLTKTFNTFGIKPYNGSNKSIKYTHCKNEKELFIKFIEYLKKDYPDIMSGWNSEFFDIPYIINRCTRVLGEEYTKDLSPLGNVHYRDIIGKFGRQQRRYYIDGISILDYLDIYKRFCFKERDSYKLDNIGEIELGEKKVNFSNNYKMHDLLVSSASVVVPKDKPESELQEFEKWCKLKDKIKAEKLKRSIK